MIRTLILIALAACLSACATPTSAIPADRPDDYTMLVTVFPVDADKAALPTPRWLRPARYAIDPSGFLRAESGLGVTRPGFPPIARRLEPREIDHLYAMAHELRARGAPIVPGVDVHQTPPDSRFVLIEIGAAGRFVATEHAADTTAPSSSLIRELARLAWLDR